MLPLKQQRIPENITGNKVWQHTAAYSKERWGGGGERKQLVKRKNEEVLE